MSLLSGIFKPVPFLDAIRTGKVSDVRKHLQRGVDPNEKVKGESGYPIHFAVHAGAEMVGLLVTHGARVDVKKEDGATPLQLAAAMGYPDVVRLLIDSGADVNATDAYGHSPLFSAAATVSPYDMLRANTGASPSCGALRERSGREAVVSLLKSRGAMLSEADAQTLAAVGSVPEADRQARHMQLASRNGDYEYHRAVEEISMEYPFLHDAHRLLLNKPNLSKVERTFIDGFQRYEQIVKRS